MNSTVDKENGTHSNIGLLSCADKAAAERHVRKRREFINLSRQAADNNASVKPALHIKTKDTGAVRCISGLTEGEADAVLAFASALTSGLLDVGTLKFITGIVEGSQDG